MYFSLIAPVAGAERDAAQVRAAGPYKEHQWLWRFFPNDPNADRDFLFHRRDINDVPRYYLVSARLPFSPAASWLVQTRPYAPRIEPGTRLSFDLRANPVVCAKRGGKPCRDDVVMAEKKRLLGERGLKCWSEWTTDDRPALYDLVTRVCGAWLKKRSESCGFTLNQEALRVDAYQSHMEKRQLPIERRLRFSTAEFSGVLTVEDMDCFHDTLIRGIGPAKAFGCGLLLVRRC